MSEQSSLESVLLSLDDALEDRYSRLAATVLADWFEAELVIVADHPDKVGTARMVASSGVSSDSAAVEVVEGTLVDDLAECASERAPSLWVVSSVELAQELNQKCDQPVYVPGSGSSAHRVPSGPLVVPLVGSRSNLDALAVAAAWARQLELGVRLVVDGSVSSDQIDSYFALLREMGVAVGIDTVSGRESSAGDASGASGPGSSGPGPGRPSAGNPVVSTVEVARSRNATAIVVPTGFDSQPIDLAAEMGVPIVLAPTFNLAELDRTTPEDSGPEPPRSSAPIPPGIRVLDYDDSLELLAQAKVARLGYVDQGWPVVVPVNYSVAGGDFIIRSVPGGKLAAAQRRDVVCLEVDGVDEETRSGWSVILHGLLEVISDPGSLRSAWERDPNPWLEGAAFEWLRLVPLSVTGRRVQPDIAP